MREFIVLDSASGLHGKGLTEVPQAADGEPTPALPWQPRNREGGRGDSTVSYAKITGGHIGGWM